MNGKGRLSIEKGIRRESENERIGNGEESL